jgi:hypothetical protein
MSPRSRDRILANLGDALAAPPRDGSGALEKLAALRRLTRPG